MEIKKMVIECTRCVLTSNDADDINLNKEGICNYCLKFEEDYSILMKLSDSNKEQELIKWVNQIKKEGIGKKYDCVCGISGGVDSSYLAVKAKELGLRVLLVHFDNGWNSELAVKNIEQICKYTGFDLDTYVVDWEEFKDLQLSYIKAGVLDWEVPTDHALWAVILKKSKKLNVKYILVGANYQTEGILPKSMRYDKADLKNIKDIYTKFGKRKKFKTFPTYPFWWHQYLKWVWGYKLAPLLYYMDFDKVKCKEYLVSVVGWRDYGGKHYESIFTRFYQGYVLKEKFGFDKRKAHLASMINSGQLTKSEAIAELEKPMIDPYVLQDDLQFFLKKMNLTAEEFDVIMKKKPIKHEYYKSYSTFEYPLFRKILSTLVYLKNIFKNN
jgi:N-acetyl sugar amidotransferase